MTIGRPMYEIRNDIETLDDNFFDFENEEAKAEYDKTRAALSAELEDYFKLNY